MVLLCSVCIIAITVFFFFGHPLKMFSMMKSACMQFILKLEMAVLKLQWINSQIF